MAGIVFYATEDLDAVERFYRQRMEMELWLDQGGCVILSHGNLLLGFCGKERAEKEGIITFFYEKREAVDSMYDELREVALCEPRENEKYNIYQFFAEDPEGRKLECQYFLDDSIRAP